MGDNIMSDVLLIAIPVTLIGYFITNQLRKRLNLQPTFYFKKGDELAEFVLENCDDLKQPFRPQFWMSNKHVQSAVYVLSERLFYNINYDREYVTMPDGEKVALDWVPVKDGCTKKNIMVILPGITGNREGYGSVCQAAADANFRTVLVNKRGHGGSKLSKPKLLGFGDGSDLQCVLETIKNRYPQSRIAAIGLSAGSALLVSCVGQFKEKSFIDVGVGISPGYDAEKLFKEAPFSRVYHRLMLNNLKRRIIMPNIECLCQAGVDKKKIERANSIHELDVHLYSKVNGFDTVEDYWQKNDPKYHMGKHSVPFLCINSVDDPVCLEEFIPYEDFRAYGKILLLTVDKGGHCGFRESLAGGSWATTVSIGYINAVLSYLEKSDAESS